MKKRVGTKLYDTDSSEFLGGTEWGELYRKRTRNGGLFVVTSKGVIIPVSPEKAKEWMDIDVEPTGSSGYLVRVDKETHAKLRMTAEKRGTAISKIVKELVAKL